MKCETCGEQSWQITANRNSGYDFYDPDTGFHRHWHPADETFQCASGHQSTVVKNQPCGAQGCSWGIE